MTTDEAIATARKVCQWMDQAISDERSSRAIVRVGQDDAEALRVVLQALARVTAEREDWKKLAHQEGAVAVNYKRAWEESQAELRRVTAERDRLIEAWPEYGDRDDPRAIIYYPRIPGDPCRDKPDEWWWDDREFPSREAAVRAAAGLDAKEGA
jgi:hypothetical protein